MESKLLTKKYFLYATEFFAGMSVMAVELGASRLMAPYFSSSQIVWTVIIGVIMIAMAIGNVWGGRRAGRRYGPGRARAFGTHGNGGRGKSGRFPQKRRRPPGCGVRRRPVPVVCEAFRESGRALRARFRRGGHGA